MGQQVQELATLRHRTASGQLDSFWEFFPRCGFSANRILAMIKLASAPSVEVEIPVCSHRSPLPGCWIIVRRGEHSYLLTAALMPMDMMKIARAAAYHSSLPVGSLVLTDAPEQVATELSFV